MKKRIISLLMAIAIVITCTLCFNTEKAEAAVTTISTEAQLKKAFTDGGTYIIGKNITVSSQLVVPTGKSVVLYCKNKAYTITSKYSGNSIVVKKGGTLRIGNTVDDDYKLTVKRTAKSKRVVDVKEGGNFYFYSGNITTAGYGVYNEGKCSMYKGATIKDCKSAGIFISRYGTFTMYNGNINNINPVEDLLTMGKGVENRGLTKIYGGSIKKCGRGVSNNGKAIIYNCTISNNTVHGVFNSAELQVQNATIATNDIGIANTYYLIMNGGRIYNNTYGITTGTKFYEEYLDEYLENYYADHEGVTPSEIAQTYLDIYNARDLFKPISAGGKGIEIPFQAYQIVDDATAVTHINGGNIHNNEFGIHNTNGSLYMSGGTILSNYTYGVWTEPNTNTFAAGCKITNNGTNPTGPNPSGIYNTGHLFIDKHPNGTTNTIISKNKGQGVYSTGYMCIMNGSFNNNTKSGVCINGGEAYITGGVYFDNGEYGIYTKKRSYIKEFYGYNMPGNGIKNINFSI